MSPALRAATAAARPRSPALVTGDAAVGLEVAVVGAVSAAIVLAPGDLRLATVVVLAAIASRCLVWGLLPARHRDLTLRAELVFLLVCTAVGAFNDWNSVTARRIYDYTVPLDLPALSRVPTWMLLYWGLILRALCTVLRWERLGLGPPPTGLAGGARPRPVARLLVLALLVLATRQAIYRLYLDPLGSWLPFAAALGLAALLLRHGRRRWLVALGLGALGAALEVLYIQVGHLHRYHLGWLGGVPVWIALWWVLALLVWDELSRPLSRALARLDAPQAWLRTMSSFGLGSR